MASIGSQSSSFIDPAASINARIGGNQDDPPPTRHSSDINLHSFQPSIESNDMITIEYVCKCAGLFILAATLIVTFMIGTSLYIGRKRHDLSSAANHRYHL